MKAKPLFPAIEVLEARIAPATLDITNGIATYTAGAGQANSLTLSYAAGKYTFSDVETITATGNGAASVTNSGTMSVDFTPFSGTKIVINLGDGNDSLQLSGLLHPLTVNDGTGADSILVSGTATSINVVGAISLAAESIDVSSKIATNQNLTGAVTLIADSLNIGATVQTRDAVIRPLTAGRPINLGPETGGALSLTNTEIGFVNVPISITIGADTAGPLTITDSITRNTGATLSLVSGGAITEVGAGSLSVVLLALKAGGDITLTNASNAWSFFGANATGPAGKINIRNDYGFDIANSNGIITDSNGSIVINAGGSVTQTLGSIQTGSLTLLGSADYNLPGYLLAQNEITKFAANTTNAIRYLDATGFTVDAIGGTAGVTTGNHDLTLIAGGGDLTVAQPVNAGTAKVTLQAGSAENDYAINVNAAVTGTGSDLALTADHLVITAAINAGTNAVTLVPFELSTGFALGGADGTGILGLTDGELDLITATSLTIGQTGATGLMSVDGTISPAGATTLIINAGAISGTGSITVPILALFSNGTIALPGTNDVDRLTFVSNTPGGPNSFADADGFVLDINNGSDAFDQHGPATALFDVGTATVSNATGATLVFDLNDTGAGTGFSQLQINGTVDLAGSTLVLRNGGALPRNNEYVIISNDGTDDGTGTFDALGEGDAIPNFSPQAFITYHGGDGNDVAVIVPDALGGTPSANGKSFSFRDVDGDLVTITTSAGKLTAANVVGYKTGGPNGASVFQSLLLDSTFTGANISITAKPTAGSGNGFVNLGYLNATGVDLGNVSIAGDLSRVSAGTNGGDAKVPAMKSLTAQSIGLLGASGLAPADLGFVGIETKGALPKLTVKADLRGDLQIGDTDGNLGTVTIGGSIVGVNTISAGGSIGLIKVVGDIRDTLGTLGIGTTKGTIGALTVDGGIYGKSAATPIFISAFGLPTAPAKGIDLAIKNVTVKGSVQYAAFRAGVGGDGDADASIGAISVGGDWIGSSVLAGTAPGPDGQIGTADDEKVSTGVQRDNLNLESSIGSFIVKGQAIGTYDNGSDMFGVVAEQIGTAKVGSRTFAFTKTGKEAFFAAPTLTGAGAESPAFDFTIRELGSTTPTGTVTGGVNLQITADGKTATYNDVDGDIVTVKRTAGTFSASDFSIGPAATGGGQLTQLVVTIPPTAGAVSLTITAKPGADGGNGFVNVGDLLTQGVTMGSVTIAGDLGRYAGGLGVNGKFGTGSLTVHSFGALGTSTGASTIKSSITDGIGKLTVGADLRGVNLFNGGTKMGDVTIGGAFISASGAGIINSNSGIGAVKVGGSMLGGRLLAQSGAIGAISIGGDLVGPAFVDAIQAFGQVTAPTKGVDLAVKSLAVRGTIENATINLGLGQNADASIGAVSAGRGWMASSLAAGVASGLDGFFGTTDDVTAGINRDQQNLFSTIASITITGQAFGTPATGDSFGIVAEQINAAKIGAATLKLDKGQRDPGDRFAIAPTGPGIGSPTPMFDFYLQEISQLIA